MKKYLFIIAILFLSIPSNALFYGEMGMGLGYTRSQTYETRLSYNYGYYRYDRNVIWYDHSTVNITSKIGYQAEDNIPVFFTLASSINVPVGWIIASGIIYYPTSYLQLATSYGYELFGSGNTEGRAMEFSLAYDYGKDRGSLTGIKVFTTFGELQSHTFLLFYSFRYSRSSSVGGSGTRFPTIQRM